MTEAEARSIAEDNRTSHGVPVDQQLVKSEQRIIELLEQPPPAATVRDCLVWIVRFSAGARWTELAIDQSTGAVVRVERSRE